ncbi:hypothetical protein [Methylobacterium komagatae]
MEIKSIYNVLRILEDRKISFALNRSRPDSIRVDATLYGIRLEIECFDDNHIEVATFRGSEDIDGGFDFLLQTINENSLD